MVPPFFLDELGERLLTGGDPITSDEALAVAELPDSDVPALIACAHRLRLQRSGPGVELESILSAKTGACSEDCSFCSQSRHWRSPLRPEPFIDLEEMVDAARAAEAIGSTEFCIVLAVRGPDDRIMEQVLAAVAALHASTSLRVACSLGILTRQQAATLAAAGLRRCRRNEILLLRQSRLRQPVVSLDRRLLFSVRWCRSTNEESVVGRRSGPPSPR